MINNETECYVLIYEHFGVEEVKRIPVKFNTGINMLVGDYLKFAEDLTVKVMNREMDFSDLENPKLYIRANKPRVK